jgi:transposase, IS5 family
MARCWLKGSIGDAINTVLAAAGFNLRWLMRAQVRLLFLLANISALARTYWAALLSELGNAGLQLRRSQTQLAGN